MKNIRQEIEERNITSLIHFTHWRNLSGIYQLNSIVSKKKLFENNLIDKEDILFKHNDSQRLDGDKYINLSITNPNKKLFQVFQSRTQTDASINWCVIQLDVDLLFDSSIQCFFSVTNAASNTAKKYGIGKDLMHFKNMFNNKIHIQNMSSSRIIERNSHKKNETTDNQAEVLVLGDISDNYVKKVCFKNERDLKNLETTWKYFYNFNTEKFIVDKSLFI